MAVKGDRLGVGQYLQSNFDYLLSANNRFFLCMQEDGNLCVYHGTGPGDNHGLVWAANIFDTPCYLVMQGDGNLCVYKGDPNNQGDFVWGLNGMNRVPFGDQRNWGSVAIMQGDGNFVVYSPKGEVIWGHDHPPAVTNVEMENVTYHMDQMQVSDTYDPNMVPMQLINRNDSDAPQTETLAFSQAYAKTSSWSTTDSISVGVSMSIPAIPVLNEGSVSISVTESHSYTYGGSDTATSTITASIPVTAQPHTTVECNAVLRKRTFIIPYTGNAWYTYGDGVRTYGPISGAFSGVSYFLDAHTVPLAEGAAKAAG